MKAALFTFIGFAASACYALGYWGSFGVDPFPYMSASDFAMYALRGLLPSLFLAALGFAGGTLSNSGPRSAEEALSFSFRRDGVLVIIGLVFCARGWFLHRPEIAVAGAVFSVGTIASFRLVRHGAFFALSKNPLLRHQAIVACFAFPILALITGAQIGVGRLNDQSQVVSNSFGARANDLEGTIFLGHLGEYDAFLVSASRQTIVVRSDIVGGLVLGKANKSLQPTATAVTPPAGQEARQP